MMMMITTMICYWRRFWLGVVCRRVCVGCILTFRRSLLPLSSEPVRQYHLHIRGHVLPTLALNVFFLCHLRARVLPRTRWLSVGYSQNRWQQQIIISMCEISLISKCYGLDDGGIRVQFPAGTRDFFYTEFRPVPTPSPTFCSIGTRGKAAGTWSWPLIIIKIPLSYISTPWHDVMAWCLINKE
jgi:hypothetical protein